MKPTTEIAEGLASYLTERLESNWEIGKSSCFCDEADFDKADSKDITQVVKETIPLLELLEVARAVDKLELYQGGIPNRTKVQVVIKALSNLKQKLPEL